MMRARTAGRRYAVRWVHIGHGESPNSSTPTPVGTDHRVDGPTLTRVPTDVTSSGRNHTRSRGDTRVLLHAASGPRICSSTASCSSNEGQLGFQRLDAPSLRGDAVGDRRQLRRRQSTGQRKRAGRRREARTESGQALHLLGYPAELSDEFLDQAGNHAGCALPILGHRLSPFRGCRVPKLGLFL